MFKIKINLVVHMPVWSMQDALGQKKEHSKKEQSLFPLVQGKKKLFRMHFMDLKGFTGIFFPFRAISK